VLIVVLALWLIGISLVLRFFGVTAERRCAVCGGEVELWPESRRCVDCGEVMADAPLSGRAGTWLGSGLDPVHALVAAVVQGRVRGERPRRAGAPAHYQRASSGKTRSANSRTLS
jgi:hypothetical protein